MRKTVLSLGLVAATALAGAAFAQSGGHPGMTAQPSTVGQGKSKGASEFAPGQGAKNPGVEGGTPPGQMMKKKKSSKKAVKKSTKATKKSNSRKATKKKTRR